MVKVEGLDKLLAEHPFFDGMNEDMRKTLSGCARNERFGPGEFVAHEGDPADRFYFVRAGAIALEFHVPGCNPIVLETLHGGEVFGWSWLVPPYAWTYDIRVLELTRLISLDGACLRKKLNKDHELGFELYSRFVPVMAKRLSSARLQLSEMDGRPC
ncbi:MAG: cyclic nucleotide-binding domain-containing protein, partial [Alphaproteobacteria bacterium]|nr:cyclic nucleotide-binding domain-containing protein [Alphaproteobacteria bacterium]